MFRRNWDCFIEGELSSESDDQDQILKDEVKSYPQIFKNIVKYRNFELDTNKGIIDQVYQLKKSDYLDLIEHPFHTNYCRLYDKDYMEYLTRNKWYTIATVWLSVSALTNEKLLSNSIINSALLSLISNSNFIIIADEM